ncbi:hypothetical protein [Streptacidiphilus jiangxiensis]|uniref:Uncharacterized protein n=1 Tax=Streptacidiphilus jiangxiensis TaxID=235985 RepID=A0A1H7FCI1_STRJI|nr:hypothetical protein [Streptacidiphilus jiangxiensis]SEK23791.1 hypothetical protein SAMN05414137_101196 [Streptacidiphilus jiangxiensis]
MNVQEVAAEMLWLPPSITRWWDGNADVYAMAVWIGRLYGYDVVIRRRDPDDVGERYLDLLAVFTRIDEPGARRRAAWMGNPAADPAYQPPVTWHLDGGPGFHPPRWHPAARLVVTPEVERSLGYQRDQYRRILHDHYGVPGFLTRARSAPDLPPGPPPPPPPDTIAYPEGS